MNLGKVHFIYKKEKNSFLSDIRCNVGIYHLDTGSKDIQKVTCEECIRLNKEDVVDLLDPCGCGNPHCAFHQRSLINNETKN